MYFAIGDTNGPRVFSFPFVIIKPKYQPLLLMDGALIESKTTRMRMSGERNRPKQITKGKTLASNPVLKFLHLKIDCMSKIIRNNKRSDISTTCCYLTLHGCKWKRENISTDYLNTMSYFTAFVCVYFFLSLRSMRHLKILTLSNRCNSFHTETILKLPKTNSMQPLSKIQ